MTWPFVGSIGDQWVHPTLESDPDMNAKIDTPLNDLAAWVGFMPGQFVRLKVSLRASAVTAAATPIPFDTVLVDTAGAWNGTLHEYGVPLAGLWIASFSIVTTGSKLSCGLQGVPVGTYGNTQLIAENNTQGSAFLPPTPIRFNGGEAVYVNAFNVSATLAAFAGPVDTCYLTLDQIGYS